MTASGGHTIADGKVDGVSVGKISRYAFTNVSAGHTTAATFAAAAGDGPDPDTDPDSSSAPAPGCGNRGWAMGGDSSDGGSAAGGPGESGTRNGRGGTNSGGSQSLARWIWVVPGSAVAALAVFAVILVRRRKKTQKPMMPLVTQL